MKTRISIVAILSTALAIFARARGEPPTVEASRTLGDRNIRIEQYQEDVDVVKGEVRRRSTRSVLCVNVYETGTAKAPRRVWQTCSPLSFDWFPQGRMRSFVISGPAKQNFVVAWCSLNDIGVALVSLDGHVPPLPPDIRFDTNTQKFNWTDSPVFTIPAESIESGLGIKLKWGYRVDLTAANKSSNGWRVDGVVLDTEHKEVTNLRTGKRVDYTPKQVLQFQVFLDDDCKSADVKPLR